MMRKIIATLLISLFLICPLSLATPPENLDTLRHTLINYHDTGAYRRDISTVVRQAHDYLQFRLVQNHRSHHPQNLAMVMDIDETTLCNYPDMKQLNFGGSPQEVEALEAAGHDAPMPYMSNLYHYAIQNGIKIFFITARREDQRRATERNLKADGFNQFQALYLMPQNYHKNSASFYKTAMRKQIEKAGYDIVVNIGDQQSDLRGGYADMSFKIPNPYYLVA